jgi:uncharacterized protein DUF4062
MKTVYVSSTYEDLKDYRSAVFGALRKMRCDVVGMEDYPAKDQLTVARCEQDVAACELYVGVTLLHNSGGHQQCSTSPAQRRRYARARASLTGSGD